MRTSCLAASILIVCAGCRTTPQPMPVDQALRQVAEGLNAFSAMNLDQRSGLLPAEVTVMLNVTATRKTDAGVGLTTPDAPSRLMVDFAHEQTESRGNQVTLKFQNVLLADKSALISTRSPADISALVQALTNSGFMVKLAPPR